MPPEIEKKRESKSLLTFFNINAKHPAYTKIYMIRLTEKDASRPYDHQTIAKTKDILHWRYDQGYLLVIEIHKYQCNNHIRVVYTYFKNYLICKICKYLSPNIVHQK